MADHKLLPAFQNFHSVWMEITKSEHQHGGAGWEFGTCLWSPTSNARGARSYEVMRRPQMGDLVLHNYHFAPPDGAKTASYLCGWSLIAAPARVVTTEPPSAGDWAGRQEYYRIDLSDFEWLPTFLSISEFVASYGEELRGELTYHKAKFFPFTINDGQVRLNQGMYLTHVAEALYDLLAQALGVERQQREVGEAPVVAHRQYEEGGRLRREQTAFLRNTSLAREVKCRDGFKCVLCHFSPQHTYGDGYSEVSLECHQLIPLAERQDPALTHSTLADVVTLCSNCHRFIHSSRKALTLAQARSILGQG